MDQRADDIRQGIEETRQEIEETRSAMTEKLELLEERVLETVEEAKSTVEDIIENVKGTVDGTVEVVKQTVDSAKSTVEDIVENVKGTVDDTVTTMKHTVDLTYQVDQRPWLMFGGSILVGYLLGCMGERRPVPFSTSESRSFAADSTSGTGLYSVSASPAPDSEPSTPAAPPQKPGMLSGVLSQFKDELDIIKAAAIGALMATLRDMIKQSMPRLAPQLEKAINSATTKLGGLPLDHISPASPYRPSQVSGEPAQPTAV